MKSTRTYEGAPRRWDSLDDAAREFARVGVSEAQMVGFLVGLGLADGPNLAGVKQSHVKEALAGLTQWFAEKTAAGQ